ncbi:unnamed protein product, partial [Protopolystoma xenopodis]
TPKATQIHSQPPPITPPLTVLGISSGDKRRKPFNISRLSLSSAPPLALDERNNRKASLPTQVAQKALVQGRVAEAAWFLTGQMKLQMRVSWASNR